MKEIEKEREKEREKEIEKETEEQTEMETEKEREELEIEGKGAERIGEERRGMENGKNENISV